MPEIIEEFIIKKQRLVGYLKSKGLDGILLTKRSNYSWITCGCRNKIMDASQNGASSILLYMGVFYLITTNIEIKRMTSEEINNLEFIEKVIYDWFNPNGLNDALRQITDFKKIVQDCPIVKGLKVVGNDFDFLKFELTKQEIERYNLIGQMVSKCMTSVCIDIKPGMTEFEVQGNLSNCLISKGIMPFIILVGSDDRIFKHRHPVPTEKKIKKYVMVVAGAEKWGLIVALTRFVHFGTLNSNLKKIINDTLSIEADMILNSKPGVKYSEIFKRAVVDYQKLGYENEWMKHHQGAPIGYEGRYFLTNLNNNEIIGENHAIAWNPSITGFKSEDTFIVTKSNNNLISIDTKWPLAKVEFKEKDVFIPGILIN